MVGLVVTYCLKVFEVFMTMTCSEIITCWKVLLSNIRPDGRVVVRSTLGREGMGSLGDRQIGCRVTTNPPPFYYYFSKDAAFPDAIFRRRDSLIHPTS